MVRKMALIGVVVCLWTHVVMAQSPREGGTSGATPAASATPAERGIWSDAGWGVLAVVSNIFYMPAKLVYSGVGVVTGGLAYLVTVGDSDTAQKVWNPSVGGNYIVTPAMLRGEEPILFNGPSYSTD